MNIRYQRLKTIDTLRQAVELQKLAWGDDPAKLVPLHMLYSMATNGAPIIGAFDEGLLVGVSIAFLGTDVQDSDRPALANLKLASKRLVVHPDYRSAGIGYHLKLHQKAFADAEGIRLITWTFDPLISRNAHVHIRKLGGLVRRFYPQFFGDIPGQVDDFGYSDRMFCEWWITSNRVAERLHGKRRDLMLDHYQSGNAPIINPTHDDNGLAVPSEGSFALGENSLILVEIPAELRLLQEHEDLIHSWREHLRRVFAQTFGFGYIITDFLHETYEGRERSFYVMGLDRGNLR